MKIVLDANVLMSAIIKDSLTRELITKAEHQLYAPDIVFDTLLKYRALIIKKTNADPDDLDSLIDGLFGYLKVLPRKNFEHRIKKAKEAMKNIDVEDAVFVACALSLQGSVIWSNDKHLKKQRLVKVYDTEEISRII